MAADTIFDSKGDHVEKKEDHSATIIIVGRVSHTAGLVQLDGRTQFYYRRAVRAYFQRTKIINHRNRNGVIDTRMTNRVILVVTSFDRRKRERAEAVERVTRCLASYQDIPGNHIIKAVEGVAKEGMMTVRDIASAIQQKQFPADVIIAGDKPLFPWFDPLRKILNKQGISPQYLEGYEAPLEVYA